MGWFTDWLGDSPLDFLDVIEGEDERTAREAKEDAIQTTKDSSAKAVDAIKSVDEQFAEGQELAGKQANAKASAAKKSAKETALTGGGSKLAAALAGAQAAGDAASDGYTEGLQYGMQSSANAGQAESNANLGKASTSSGLFSTVLDDENRDKDRDLQGMSNVFNGIMSASNWGSGSK